MRSNMGNKKRILSEKNMILNSVEKETKLLVRNVFDFCCFNITNDSYHTR
jgi:hypothetical protein